MSFHIDSWPWKFALILAILGARGFVTLVSNAMATYSRGATPRGPMNPGSRRVPEKAPDDNAKWLTETLDSAAIAIGLVLFIIQPFLIQAFYIPSGSMENTLLGPPPGQTSGGDRLLVSRLLYRLRDPKFQEVVVFKAPPRAEETSAGLPEGENDFIKRCIGEPGDIVYAANRKYYRIAKGSKTAVLLREPYVKWSPAPAFFSYDMKIVGGHVYSREYHTPNIPDDWTRESHPNTGTQEEQQALQQRINNAAPEAIPDGKYLVLGDHRNNSNDGHAWGFVPRENFIGKALCIFWPPKRVGVLDRISVHTRKPPASHNNPPPVEEYCEQ